MGKKKVVLFGTGGFAEKNISIITQYLDIIAVCDNDSGKCGRVFNGKYRILSVDETIEAFLNFEFIITVDTKKVYDEIFLQLKNRGISARHVNDAILEECIEKQKNFYLSEEGFLEVKRIEGTERNIFILTAPPHSNLGDQAQAMCAQEMIAKKYKGRIFIYDQNFVLKNYFEILYIIKQHLKPEDMLFLHSGYRFTDLYMDSVYAIEMIAKLYNNRKMVFLPQTVCFSDMSVKKKLSQELGNNITIMCRDKISLNEAETTFLQTRNLLYPDLVTSLIGKYCFTNKRKGILFCLRVSSDGESLLSDMNARKLAKKLSKYDEVSFTDTTIDEPYELVAENRKFYVEREIERYSQYKIIITNRLHGMIFGMAANTPVVSLPTKNHKVTAAKSWFVEAGYQDIYLCSNDDEIELTIKNKLDNYKPSCNSDYFYAKYFRDFDPWNL